MKLKLVGRGRRKVFAFRTGQRGKTPRSSRTMEAPSLVCCWLSDLRRESGPGNVCRESVVNNTGKRGHCRFPLGLLLFRGQRGVALNHRHAGGKCSSLSISKEKISQTSRSPLRFSPNLLSSALLALLALRFSPRTFHAAMQYQFHALTLVPCRQRL